MNKILRFIDALGLSTSAFNISNRVNNNNDDRTSPHVDRAVELPHTRWAKVSQTIQVHVPCHSQDSIELWIYVPKNFEFQTATLEITDSAEPTLSERDSTRSMLSERTIHAPIYRQDRWLQIKFARSIAPDTKLQIDFDRVNRSLLAPSSEYFVYGISVNSQYSFLGRGYFHRSDRF
jgi:hypothetical protein